MKQNTEKQQVAKKVPFNVPDGYFFDLKNNIQSHTENLSSREGFDGIFTSKKNSFDFCLHRNCCLII